MILVLRQMTETLQQLKKRKFDIHLVQKSYDKTIENLDLVDMWIY
jgi:hypothetical protein